MSRRAVFSLCGGALFLTAVVLRPGVSADKPAGNAPEPKDKGAGKTERLGGADRYLTHVSTDKPIYKGGEAVRIRGVVLHAHTRAPLDEKQNLTAFVEILGPKGDVVSSGYAQSVDSVIGFQWAVPEGQAGGEYKAKITHVGTGDPPAERKFDVRAYRAPRLKSQIVFVRDGYGPGDTVAASIKVDRAEGGAPAGAKVTVQARVDGETVHESITSVSPDGLAAARFDLPKEIARGEGTLAFIVEDGGIVETASKTIPILLQTIDLNLYPEGGELVAGLPNRVYIAALTPAKKPADLKGVVVDSKGAEVASLRTEHEGRGRATFTPRTGERYTLKIVEPAGIRTTYPLPEVKDDGAVVASLDEVTPAGKKVALRVGSTKSEVLTVVLSRRETELSRATVAVKGGEPQPVSLDAQDASGVLVATVWNAAGEPLAERLVFRQPKDAVTVEITSDKPSYTPGSPAKLKVKTTGSDGKPVSAVVGLTVTDDSVLEMIEKREQAPRLPVMALLEDDVKDLADAHVYLDPQNPKAGPAVDLLLGTQGWRRFAFVETEKFLAEHGDAARRVVAIRTVTEQDRQRGQQMLFLGRAAGFGGANQRGGAIPPPAPAPGGVAPAKADGGKPGVAAPAGRGPVNAPAAQAVAPAAGPVPASAVKAEGRPAPRPNAPVESKPAPDPAQNAKDAQLQAAAEAGEKKAAEKEFALRDIDGRRRQLARQLAVVIVREFAHQVRADRKPGDRIDFAETLYWHAGVRTDETTGEAEVAFAMSDAVTSFRVFADAFTNAGALGATTTAIESVEPFYVEPKLPLEVTSGDVIRLPIGLVNRTPEELSQATLLVEAKGLKSAGFDPFPLAADTRVRRVLALDVGRFSGSTTVALSATAGPYADKVTRPLVVSPLGFPIEIGKGGMLAANETATHEISIPDQIVPGSLTASVAVYPTPLANMTAALERLIQEPYGCFEQTSSTTYPLVMAQQYFTTHTGIDPATIQKANDILERGYQRLIGYECKQGGYEWFGQDPGHEALTAYGLLEFTDMAAVRPVDTAMIDRTRTWLLGRRDGQGGFKRERRALHTWIEDRDCSNAYITWALLRGGVKDLASEVATVKIAGEKSSNSYVVALAANVLHQAGDKAGRNQLLDSLVQLQTPSGAIQGATTSIIGSGGDALVIEATALATLAWLTDEDYIDFADKGVKYLAESCKGGRFGSTQSTVLALAAIVEQDKALARPKSPGSVQLLVDGKPVGEPVKFDTNTQGAIALPDMSSLLTTGRHTVAVKMEGGSTMPHAVTVKLHSTRPDSSEACALRIETALRDAKVTEGAVTEVQVKVTNTKDEAVPTPIALIGVPGGLEVRHDQLKELVKSGKIAAYEVLGRNVVLYWREMTAKQSVELPVSLVAAVPGTYSGPASRAYLYYTDEHKQWSNPLKVQIAPRAE